MIKEIKSLRDLKDLHKNPKKAAYFIGSGAFLGFLLIIPVLLAASLAPRMLAIGILFTAFYIMGGPLFAGFLVSGLIGLASYPVFKRLAKKELDEKKFRITLIVVSIILAATTFFVAGPLIGIIVTGVEKAQNRVDIKELDTNNDGKTDTWTYASGPDKGKRIEKDTNFDGKADIIDFYESQGYLTNRSIDSDFDGKMDIFETYRADKLVWRKTIKDGKEIAEEIK